MVAFIVCCRSGRSRGPTGESGASCSSRESSPSGESTFSHGAANSSASGRASSRWQIAMTVGPLADVRRKSGSTSRTRSRNSRTAGERTRSPGDRASTWVSRARDPTAYSRSPRRWSGARLVTSTRSEAADDRISAMSGAASRTCSKLSRTSSVGLPSHAVFTRFGKSAAGVSTSPRASAIAAATRPVSRMAASGTSTTRAVPSAAISRASSSARRVFPAPPGPVRVMRRAERSVSHCRSTFTSSSRPTNAVGASGSDRLRSSSRPESETVSGR